MTKTYCAASDGVRLHETFTCIEPPGHPGPHRGGVYHDPCPNCGAVEDHTDECPTPDLMEDKTTPLTEAVWDRDSTEVRLEPWSRATSETTCPRCDGTGKVRGFPI